MSLILKSLGSPYQKSHLLHDSKRARRLLGELARDAGASPYKAQAKALLELENLRATVANLERAAKGAARSTNELEAQLASAREALERCERQLEELRESTSAVEPRCFDHQVFNSGTMSQANSGAIQRYRPEDGQTALFVDSIRIEGLLLPTKDNRG